MTAIIRFPNPNQTPSKRRLADLPDRVVEGDPHHTTHLSFCSTDGKLKAGTWTSTPGKWLAFPNRDEFCIILSGHCELIDADGTVNTFRTGDAFVVPDGFRGFWHVVETTTKHFVIRDLS